MSFDMNKMLREAQRMQEELAKAQAEGAKEIVEIAIDPRAIDPDDPELLADMVLAAVNEALRSAQGLMQSKVSGLIPGDLGSLGLPGL